MKCRESSLNNKGPSLNIVIREGLTPYGRARSDQLSFVEKRKNEQIGDTLLVVEHEPVITLGLGASESGVVASREHLHQMGIEVIRVERGGKTTYHGPGQVVVYPILNLDHLHLGVKSYVTKLEDTMILAAQRIGLKVYRTPGMVGVFCDRGKIGAIGVRVTKGICFHGFAFNLAPDLSHYQLIVPCGMQDVPVTSAREASGECPSFEKMRDIIVESFLEIFGFVPASGA